MSETVLSQLQIVVSTLEAEEAALNQQLSAVKPKLGKLRSVVDLFTTSDAITITESVETATEEPSVATIETTPQKKSPVAAVRITKTKPKSRQKDGRTSDWQKYVLPKIKNKTMPDAVKLILSANPDKDFRIAEVMSELFKKTMPRVQYIKARNRISNILSGGVRSGDWYKGERSTYRLNATD